MCLSNVGGLGLRSSGEYLERWNSSCHTSCWSRLQMKKQKAKQLNQVWSQKRLRTLAISFPITLIPTRKLNADKKPLWHSANSSVYGAWKHVKLPITQNGWEPESTALFESLTKGLPPPAPADMAGWLDVFLCLFALCAGKLNLWNRWIEGWPSQNHLIAKHKSQIFDRNTWLEGQTPSPSGYEVSPESSADISFLSLSSHVWLQL